MATHRPGPGIRAKAAAAALLVALPAAAGAQIVPRGDCGGRRPSGWELRIAPEDEPGQPLVVSGRVLSSAGEPLAGMTVFAFHTDARGYYSEGGMDEGNARLCGLVETDAEGRYRFDTIRPAHYATGGPPAHVHFRVWGPGVARQNFTLNFADDPRLAGRGDDAEHTPAWATIRPVTRDADGVQYVERDLRLR